VAKTTTTYFAEFFIQHKQHSLDWHSTLTMDIQQRSGSDSYSIYVDALAVGNVGAGVDNAGATGVDGIGAPQVDNVVAPGMPPMPPTPDRSKEKYKKRNGGQSWLSWCGQKCKDNLTFITFSFLVALSVAVFQYLAINIPIEVLLSMISAVLGYLVYLFKTEVAVMLSWCYKKCKDNLIWIRYWSIITCFFLAALGAVVFQYLNFPLVAFVLSIIGNVAAFLAYFQNPVTETLRQDHNQLRIEFDASQARRDDENV
jgi:hypothetical protein